MHVDGNAAFLGSGPGEEGASLRGPLLPPGGYQFVLALTEVQLAAVIGLTWRTLWHLTEAIVEQPIRD